MPPARLHGIRLRSVHEWRACGGADLGERMPITQKLRVSSTASCRMATGCIRCRSGPSVRRRDFAPASSCTWRSIRTIRRRFWPDSRVVLDRQFSRRPGVHSHFLRGARSIHGAHGTRSRSRASGSGSRCRTETSSSTVLGARALRRRYRHHGLHRFPRRRCRHRRRCLSCSPMERARPNC